MARIFTLTQDDFTHKFDAFCCSFLLVQFIFKFFFRHLKIAIFVCEFLYLLFQLLNMREHLRHEVLLQPWAT